MRRIKNLHLAHQIASRTNRSLTDVKREIPRNHCLTLPAQRSVKTTAPLVGTWAIAAVPNHQPVYNWLYMNENGTWDEHG